MLSSPIPSVQCCAFVLATYRKQQTPATLNGGDRGGVRILLFSEVTLVKYNVLTILSPIVAYFSNKDYRNHETVLTETTRTKLGTRRL